MRSFTYWLAIVGMVAIGAAVLLTVLDICLRSVSTATVPGLTDIVTLLVMTGALLSIPYAFVTDQHVAIDVFTAKLSVGAQRGLALFASALGIIVLSSVLWFSTKQAILEYGYGDRSQSIGIPMIAYWVPMLIGLAISVLANVWIAIRLLRDRAGEEHP